MAKSAYKRKSYAAEPLSRGLVYVAINSINNKKYFGITARDLQRRIENHWGSSRDKKRRKTAFANALNKYGKENIKFHKIFEASSYDEAKFIEKGLIEIFKPEYNLTLGGEGALGYRHSPETIEKIKKNRIPNANQFQKGHMHSKETLEKIAKTKSLNPYHGYWIGKKRSPETIEKYKKSRTGKPCLALKGKSLSAAALDASARIRRKPVICINDSKKFPSVSEAAIYYNTTRTAICRVCDGKRKKNHGFVFIWGTKHEQ